MTAPGVNTPRAQADHRHPLIIAIDGTFASGKGTLGKALAAHYGLKYLDTGKLYRIIALKVVQDGGDVDNPAHCVNVAHALDPDSRATTLAEHLKNPELKSGPIGAAASKVAVHQDVRTALLKFQRDFASQGAVLDGRDIGTVICPHADVKLYIDATQAERAQRRHAELTRYGETHSFAAVLTQLQERDGRDSGRDIAPLKPADDAHLIDTTGLAIPMVLASAIAITDAVLAAR